MKIKFLLVLLALGCSVAEAQVPPPVEASAAQVAAGAVGAPYYVSPRRLAGGGGPVVASSVTDTGLTAGRVTFAGTGGLLSDDADLTFATDTLTFTKGVTTQLALGATTPGLITGTLGAITLTGAGTNQNITLAPSGTGSATVTTASATSDPGLIVINTNTGGGSMASFRRSDGAIRMQVGFGQAGVASPLTSAPFINVTTGFPLIFGQGSLFGTTEMGRFAATTGAFSVTSNINSTGGEIQTAGNRVNYNLSVYGVGTAYAFTNTAAAIDFGTTDPVKVLDKVGTYLISAQVHIAYNGATVATETATIKVRRTNNTAADLSAVVVLDLPVATTLTHTYGIFQIPPFIYTTAATDDSITIFANVSAALGAGTIDATAIGTSLIAVRLY